MGDSTPQSSRRIRELGITPGILPTGKANAITDIPEVRVGHTTIIEGDSIRTGVTAILPHPRNITQEKVFAGCAVGNGHGKCAGLIQLRELGTIETPIVLTNTLAVGTAMHAIVRWTINQPGNEDVQSINPIVGECSDRVLNDIRALRVTKDDVIAAIDSAKPQAAEGNVGSGTGMVAFGFKGGIGTSSRQLPGACGGWTLGAIVQANFGGVLTIDGRRIGEQLGQHSFRDELHHQEGGSCMIVLATDAPLSPRQLNRIAQRAFLGLARTGSFMSNGSGDIAIAFSTAQHVPHTADARTIETKDVHNNHISPLFLAAVEAVEESVYNALTMAETMTGHHGATIKALDHATLRR